MRSQIKQLFILLGLIDVYRRLKCSVFSLRPSNWRANQAYRRQGGPDRFPIPPNWLIYLTINNPSVFDYFRGGFVTFRAIQRLLYKNHVDLQQFGQILDFGCGCGRVIREFPSTTTAALFGCDYNSQLIDWCASYLYCADFRVNGFEPPSPYAADSFDFAYLISVFTHLPVSVQQAWLRELHRILKPGGYLIITLHGEHLMPKLTAAERHAFATLGYAERALDVAGSNHFGTFHSRRYFEQMLIGLFTLVDHSPGGQPNHPYQDLYLLQKVGAVPHSKN